MVAVFLSLWELVAVEWHGLESLQWVEARHDGCVVLLKQYYVYAVSTFSIKPQYCEKDI